MSLKGPCPWPRVPFWNWLSELPLVPPSPSWPSPGCEPALAPALVSGFFDEHPQSTITRSATSGTMRLAADAASFADPRGQRRACVITFSFRQIAGNPAVRRQHQVDLCRSTAPRTEGDIAAVG